MFSVIRLFLQGIFMDLVMMLCDCYTSKKRFGDQHGFHGYKESSLGHTYREDYSTKICHVYDIRFD